MSITFAGVGEAMLELSERDGRFDMNYAGDVLNVCYYLAQFSVPGKTSVQFASALGTDCYSQAMLAYWQKHSINTDLVTQINGEQPGLYLIRIDPDGERHFYYYRQDSAARKMFSDKVSLQKLDSLRQMKYIYFSGVTLAILDSISQQRLLKIIQTARSHGSTIVFDTNYRPRLWSNRDSAQNVIKQALSLTHIALPTFVDEALLWDDTTPDDTIKRMRMMGVKEIVVKNGDRSCVIDCNGRSGTVPSELVSNVVDTTAAGDSFNAGYMAARMANKNPEQAALCGHKLAAAVIGHRGALLPPEKIPPILG